MKAWYLSLAVWPASLSVTVSGPIHVLPVALLSLQAHASPLYIMSHAFLIRFSSDAQWGGSHVLALVKSAVMNIGVRVSFQIRPSFLCIFI